MALVSTLCMLARRLATVVVVVTIGDTRRACLFWFTCFLKPWPEAVV